MQEQLESVWPLILNLPSLPLPNLQKGWAKSEHRGYLDQCLISYTEKKSTNVKKATEYANAMVVNKYFNLFYWVLPLDQDLHKDDPPCIPDELLSDKQRAVKGAIIKQMANAIVKRLDYHAGKVASPATMTKKERAHDLIVSFLSRLAGVEATCGRALTAKQLFRKDNDDISRCFDTFWTANGGKGKDQPAACAAFIAEEFAKLSEEDQLKWMALAERTAAENKKKKGQGWVEPTLLPLEDAQRVLDTLGSTMQPLLEGLSIMLGCHVSLAIAGPEPQKGGQVNIITIHEGVDKSSVPQRFHEKGGERYKLWLTALGEYILLCYMPEEQKSRALTGVGAPSGPPLFWHANPPWKEGVAGPEDVNPACKATSPTQRDARDGSDDDDNSEEEDGSEAKKSKKKKKTRSRK